VSHDRALLRGVCDEFLLVGEGVVAPFDGDLEDYASWLGKRQTPAAPADAIAAAGARRDGGGEARRRNANARQKLAPLRKSLQQIEASLATLAAQRQSLEQQLADPDFYVTASAAAQRDSAALHARLGAEIDLAETRWLELSAELEAAESAPQ